MKQIKRGIKKDKETVQFKYLSTGSNLTGLSYNIALFRIVKRDRNANIRQDKRVERENIRLYALSESDDNASFALMFAFAWCKLSSTYFTFAQFTWTPMNISIKQFNLLDLLSPSEDGYVYVSAGNYPTALVKRLQV